MKSLRQVLGEAQQNKVAVGHFNVSDLVLPIESLPSWRGYPAAAFSRWPPNP